MDGAFRDCRAPAQTPTHGSHRSWLAPAKSAEPQPKRSESGVPSPEPAERRLHLDLVTLLLATAEAGHLTQYAHNGMDAARVKRVLIGPCPCNKRDKSRCCAKQLPVERVVEYCQRFDRNILRDLRSSPYKQTSLHAMALGGCTGLCTCSVSSPGSNASHFVQACAPSFGFAEGVCAATRGTTTEHCEPILC